MTATNITWHERTVSREQRAGQKQQKPGVIWFTGLSGAGKSTLANALDCALFERGYHTYLLDGDNVRHGLNKDLGFSDKDRIENIRRVGEAAKLFVDAGMIVSTAFISPFRADRKMVRSLFEPGEFIEVFVDASLETCEARDPKGLYKKARTGVIKNFTGIDSPYEKPQAAEVVVNTAENDIEKCVRLVLEALTVRGMIADEAVEAKKNGSNGQ